MNVAAIARILGVAFLIAGLAGFIPFVAQAPPFDAQVVTWNDHYAMLFGLFPVNIGHDAIHLIFGLWGLLAGFTFKSSVAYCRSVAWIYGAFVLIGLIPILNTLFGIVPIYGHDIWLHLLIGLVAFWGGYGRPANVHNIPVV